MRCLFAIVELSKTSPLRIQATKRWYAGDFLSRKEGKFTRPPVVTVAAEVKVDKFKSMWDAGDYSSEEVESSSTYGDIVLVKL